MTTESVVERGDALFIDISRAFAGSPQEEWIPFLPRPGKYTHPRYGVIDVTPEQNAQLVESVKNRVYQEYIPLDAEHETKLSGAVAWIKDMRLNSDSSGDALVAWTPRGAKLIADGRYRYVSPEWFRTWKDPATDEVHSNVIAGGALTTRPFFKDKSLRALVASEEGADVIGDEQPEPVEEPQDPKEASVTTPAENPQQTPPPAQEPSLTSAEVDERITAAKQEFAEQLESARAEAATEKAAREAAEARLAALEHDRRLARFTDMVLDFEGGARWFGDAEKHVSILETLATSFGEDSEVFKTYVEQQSSLAQQIRASSVFEEIGSSQASERGSTEAKLDAMAKEIQKSKPGLTFAQAYTEAISTDEGKKLYAQLSL